MHITLNSKESDINTQTHSALLVADIGGTHVRFGRSDNGVLDRVEKYRCDEFETLAAAISHYLEAQSLGNCAAACLAVAATTESDRIKLTNSDWSFSVKELQAHFGFLRLEVINDFEAIAYSLAALKPEQKIQLGGQAADPAGNIAVLGPGTGLGVKHLTPVPDGWKVLSGEGGHVDFAPVDDDDLPLWHFLRDKHSRVSVEEILSGRGLVHIYQARVLGAGGSAEIDDPATIVERGLADTCPHCAASLQQFCAILGSFAGNLALNLNTRGGVYLCGGVLAQLREYIHTTEFRSRFDAKGRFAYYVENIPVFLIAEAEPGLLGAASFLATNK